MFGYVVADRPELKVREAEEYRGFYCGLCKTLKSSYGLKGQITLTYDLTFLAILLTALYECKTVREMVRCPVHPCRKHLSITSEYTEYAADMNILLSYYKCLDDYSDDKSLMKAAAAKILRRSGKKAAAKYPQKSHVIRCELKNIAKLEKENSKDIDRISGCFGRLMSAVFAVREDEWSRILERMGFFLGKYIYILDAWVDYDDDLKIGRAHV